MMSNAVMPLGIDSFEKIRTEGYYYIDKTGLISENGSEVVSGEGHDNRPQRIIQGNVAGIFTGAGYIVKSNREQGYGRADIIIKDRRHRRVMIIEVKHADQESRLEAECEDAVKQIDERRYADEFRKGYRTVICYGIAFWDKQCLVKKIGEVRKG